jgi:hypothetical protein
VRQRHQQMAHVDDLIQTRAQKIVQTAVATGESRNEFARNPPTGHILRQIGASKSSQTTNSAIDNWKADMQLLEAWEDRSETNTKWLVKIRKAIRDSNMHVLGIE